MKHEKNHWSGCPGGIRCHACKPNDTKRWKQGNSRAIRRKNRMTMRRVSA